MRHGSLFSGIGGFDLASSWMGWTNVFQVEIDPFCQKVLQKNFPNTKRYGDIKTFDGSKYRGTVDILTGGDPCQPHSTAGAGRGAQDSRYLWPEFLRVVKAVKPSWIVNENVSGSIANRILDQKIIDLENENYTCWPPLLIPAGARGAIHRRDRIWLVAYSNAIGSQALNKQLDGYLEAEGKEPKGSSTIDALLGKSLWSGQSKQSASNECPVVRADHGVPKELDAIAAIGNSVYPELVFEIFKAIQTITP